MGETVLKNGTRVPDYKSKPWQDAYFENWTRHDADLPHSSAATPTVNDDILQGYVVGSRWIYTGATPNVLYICRNNAAGASVWEIDVSASGSVTSHSDVTSAGSGQIITSSERTKLNGIDDGATANDTDDNLRDRSTHTGTQLAATISDFDTEVSNNTSVQANTAKVSADGSVTTHSDVTSAGSGQIITSEERAKLDGIQDGATDDQTGSEIKALYESESNTNAFTDAEKSKLASLESSKFLGTYTSITALETAHPSPTEGSYGHVDTGIGNEVAVYIWDNSDSTYYEQAAASSAETAASIKTKYESNPDTNAYTDTEKSKLAGIETGANVTDAENIGAAIDGAGEDASPADTDQFSQTDSGGVLKWTSWGTIKSLIQTALSTVFAPIAQGVTNGDSHDHDGGDGAQIAHGNLSDIGSTTGHHTSTSTLTEGDNLYFTDTRVLNISKASSVLQENRTVDQSYYTRVITGYSDTAWHGDLTISKRAGGTQSTPSAVQSGYTLQSFSVRPYNGSGFPTLDVGYFKFLATGTHSSTSAPVKFELGLTKSGDASSYSAITADDDGVALWKLKSIGVPPEYTDNSAAKTAGLVDGDIYRTGDLLKVVHS